MDQFLIDIGSSTVKIYQYDKTNSRVKLLLTKSFHFKEGFDPEFGISQNDKEELFTLIKSFKKENPDKQIKTYATAIFRKLTTAALKKFCDEFFDATKVNFNIIDHDLESFYLEMALSDKFESNEPFLLINVGGGSTELIVMYKKEAIEKYNLEIGIGIINNEFSGINESYSRAKLEDVVIFVKEKLPPLENKIKLAFYSGGELTYMNLAKYQLDKNDLFDDKDHPSKITIDNFQKRNKEIFSKLTIEELESLMPNDPKWMHGARGCSAIVQAICEKYNISVIIPSDSNTINGVVRQEFRTVTISGSFRKHLDYILKVKDNLEKS